MDYSAQRFWHSCNEGFGLFHIVLVLEKRPLAPIVSHNTYLDCNLCYHKLWCKLFMIKTITNACSAYSLAFAPLRTSVTNYFIQSRFL